MSKSIAKQETNSVAVPSYLAQYGDMGADDITSDLIESSYLQLSHEEKDGRKFGEWYNSTTGMVYGDEVTITVCKIEKNWRKFNDDFQLEASSSDGYIWDNGDLLTEDDKWKTAFIDMYVLLNDTGEELPIRLSFKGTSYKTGKKLASAIAQLSRTGREPIFARSYTLSHDEGKKGSKSYAIAKYKLNPGFNSELCMGICAKIRQMLEKLSPAANPPKSEAKEIELD